MNSAAAFAQPLFALRAGLRQPGGSCCPGTSQVKHKALVVVAVVAIAVGGGLVARWERPGQASPHRFDLNLGGPPGLWVSAAYEADGVTNALQGTTPTNLSLQARDFSYTIQAWSNAAGLRVTLYVDDLPRLSTLAGTNGGVRGHCRMAPEAETASASGF